MNNEEFIKRFGYHEPKRYDQQTVHSAASCFAAIILEVVPPGREQSLALTAIEEAMLWADAGVVRNQTS